MTIVAWTQIPSKKTNAFRFCGNGYQEFNAFLELLPDKKAHGLSMDKANGWICFEGIVPDNHDASVMFLVHLTTLVKCNIIQLSNEAELI